MNEMSTCRFAIAYEGEAVQDGRMSVKDLAPALIAVAQLFDAANSVLNDENAKVDIHVRATSEGSFEIDLELLQTVYQKVVGLLSGDTITAALQLKEVIFGGGATLGGGLIWLVKKLRGRRPERVETEDDGSLTIVLGTEVFEGVDPKAHRLYMTLDVRRALGGLIAEPLSKDGIDLFEVRSDGDVNVAVSKLEAEEFDSDALEEALTDNVYRAAYTIVSVTFRQGNKWRLFDGNSTISVGILDTDFLERVASGGRLSPRAIYSFAECAFVKQPAVPMAFALRIRSKKCWSIGVRLAKRILIFRNRLARVPETSRSCFAVYYRAVGRQGRVPIHDGNTIQTTVDLRLHHPHPTAS